jgi:fucose 4-O-acetylase-like acetyltransferase
MKQRILYWDVIKFFAIFLVVYGHVIQYLNPPERSLWNSFIGENIVSFHMPLFMIVSGYFARSLFKKDIKETVKNKFVQLVIPSVTTYFITGVILIFLRHTPVAEGLKSLLGYCVLSLLVSEGTVHILCPDLGLLPDMEA